MPVEKRLEAFVRMGHGIIIFPGGHGTFENSFIFLGIKLNQTLCPTSSAYQRSKRKSRHFASI